MVDCCVTGSDQGTSDNPKFSLRSVFEDQIFPLVESLVKHNYRGYIPVFQGDNAGPHIHADYINFVKDYCEKKWLVVGSTSSTDATCQQPGPGCLPGHVKEPP